MGFFSADCVGCGHPILHAHKTNDVNAWMNVGVAIWPDGTIRTGFYDGYGNLDERIDRCAVGQDTTVWHESCWIAAGSPEDYRGPSRPSPDQGWFFPPGAHTIPEPTPAGYELELVTADGTDAASGDYNSYVEVSAGLAEACRSIEEAQGGIVEYSPPIDGHGIIYSIELLDGEPVLRVHYRYKVTANEMGAEL